jgi:Uma2 family endonuclease
MAGSPPEIMGDRVEWMGQPQPASGYAAMTTEASVKLAQPEKTDSGEKRVTLSQVSWQAYETILAALGENRSAQLFYYQGRLEIMSPLESHEGASSQIDDFIKVITDEQNLNIKSLQSTTLNKPELQAGAEPDQCYYLANEPLVRGKTVDLQVDPAPDLVVEVDITHSDINKNALYAAMGVSEFWRYDGQTLRIFSLEAGEYQEVEASPSFPMIPKQRLYQFLQDCAQAGETQAKRLFRQWLRQESS